MDEVTFVESSFLILSIRQTENNAGSLMDIQGECWNRGN